MKDLSEKMKFEQSSMNSREMAAYWVEHAMKYGNLYLKPANHNLSNIQSYSLDIVAVFALMCCVVVIVLAKLNRLVLKKMFRSPGPKMKCP